MSDQRDFERRWDAAGGDEALERAIADDVAHHGAAAAAPSRGELAARWRRIEEGAERRQLARRRWIGAASAVAMACVAAGLVIGGLRRAPAPLPGAWVALPGRVQPGPSAVLTDSAGGAPRISAGAVGLEVPPGARPAPLVFIAGDLRVEVVGTVFTLAVRDGLGAVRVHEGAVLVTRAGERPHVVDASTGTLPADRAWADGATSELESWTREATARRTAARTALARLGAPAPPAPGVASRDRGPGPANPPLDGAEPASAWGPPPARAPLRRARSATAGDRSTSGGVSGASPSAIGAETDRAEHDPLAGGVAGSAASTGQRIAIPGSTAPPTSAEAAARQTPATQSANGGPRGSKGASARSARRQRARRQGESTSSRTAPLGGVATDGSRSRFAPSAAPAVAARARPQAEAQASEAAIQVAPHHTAAASPPAIAHSATHIAPRGGRTGAPVDAPVQHAASRVAAPRRAVAAMPAETTADASAPTRAAAAMPAETTADAPAPTRAATNTDPVVPPGSEARAPATGIAPRRAAGATRAETGRVDRPSLARTAAERPGPRLRPEELAEYRAALRLLRAGRMNAAELRFAGYVARYPKGVLTEEAELGRIEALWGAERWSELHAAADRWLARHADDPRANAVRALAGSAPP